MQGPYKLKFLAPIPEQIATATMQFLKVTRKTLNGHFSKMHYWGSYLFWHGCYESQLLAP